MSHGSASKVGEIFTAAGAAFTKLGELAVQLYSASEPSPAGSQIKNSMKRKAYEEAGIPIKKAPPKAEAAPPPPQPTLAAGLQAATKSADITLNMLNATETEVDVEGLGGTGKLDYDSSS
ncbi:BPTF-associated chromatin complex component 1 isoform X3 [Dermacentor andersoni]|uniref:chromatin complexes subunit BAP18 isoform X2 n=1 Tax=Dermacentor silvarum TaxID=543639 RepID=UPI00189AD35C|nr:chromatin complexes subunit BAP18 isoform X2 [Dermacentor silvarum]XP_050046061.1 chromatin complexes subunit BAP18-like isoform X3 [Dermacentor andersoni]